MGWEKKGSYTRSRRVNGRVLREYVGTGEIALWAAALDALARREREAAQAAERARRRKQDDLDLRLDEVNVLAELLARAALEAAGYHQHKRGEWRKRRARNN
jgi:hypothetical protein